MDSGLKIREDAISIGSSDIWYDMFDGGYFEPEQFFVDGSPEIKKVKEAIAILQWYRKILIEKELVEEL